MANYRQIHTRIWKDAWFFELSATDKLLFIYLFSNERANITGLYDLHKKIIVFESGLSSRDVEKGLETFRNAGKVFYEDGWIWIPNLIKYNSASLNSDKIRSHIVSFLSKTSDTPLKARCIDYYNDNVDEEYRIDTLSIPYQNESLEHEHEQELNTYSVRDFYDELAQSWKNYYPKKRKYGYDTIKSKVQARYNDKGFRENWQEALRLSCNVKSLRTEGWFSFEYFIRNNTNYLKLLDGGFAFKDNPDGKQAPQSPVNPVRDAKEL